MLIVIASLFITALLSVNLLLVSASTGLSQSLSTTTEQEQQQPKPGIIMIITFENGTTKAISSDSTNIRTVQGGYFIADPSVQAAKPLQSKTISSTVVQQLVSVFVDVKIKNEEDPVSPYSISSEGCGEGYGYDTDDPTPICEPINNIGQGIPPPSDQAFCAALGCPYNPPADSESPVDSDEPNNGNTNDFATTPVTPTDEPAIGPQPAEPEEQNRDQSTDDNDGDNREDGNGGGDEGEGAEEDEGEEG